jgi:hypothetical protein
VSITTDAWSSRDGSHSLLSATAHFLEKDKPKFVLLGAMPIKGFYKF